MPHSYESRRSRPRFSLSLELHFSPAAATVLVAGVPVPVLYTQPSKLSLDCSNAIKNASSLIRQERQHAHCVFVSITLNQIQTVAVVFAALAKTHRCRDCRASTCDWDKVFAILFGNSCIGAVQTFLCACCCGGVAAKAAPTCACEHARTHTIYFGKGVGLYSKLCVYFCTCVLQNLLGTGQLCSSGPQALHCWCSFSFLA